MYKYACGNFDANHPIPADQPDVDPFFVLYNVNTQELNAILTRPQPAAPARTPDEQKIGDYFKACMDTSAIDAAGLKPIQPLLDEIAALNPAKPRASPPCSASSSASASTPSSATASSRTSRTPPSRSPSSSRAASACPEKDYYLRTGDKDAQIRTQYVAHVAKMLTLAGSTPDAGQD